MRDTTILIPRVLKGDAPQACMGAMVMCPDIFVLNFPTLNKEKFVFVHNKLFMSWKEQGRGSE